MIFKKKRKTKKIPNYDIISDVIMTSKLPKYDSTSWTNKRSEFVTNIQKCVLCANNNCKTVKNAQQSPKWLSQNRK